MSIKATDSAAPATPAPATAVTQPSASARLGAARSETAQPIPYRTDAAGTAASTGSALLIAVLLLAVFALALRLAKRRGLLDRWIVAAPTRGIDRTQMQVEHALRVSPKTMVYRIRDADRRYLLVESIAHTTLIPLSDEDIAIQNDDPHHATR